MINNTTIEQRGLRMVDWFVAEDEKDYALRASGQVVAYSPKLGRLDDFIAFEKGEITIIGARPSIGKTAMGVQIIEQICRQLEAGSGVVGMFSAEMKGRMLVRRMAAALAGVTVRQVNKCDLTDAQLKKYALARERIARLPLAIDDTPAPTIDGMFKAVENCEYPILAILFDYMEKMQVKNSRGEESRVSAISQSLVHLCKAVDVPTIVLSQLSRSLENRACKLPQMSDLRYSGMIEQDADQIILLTREPYYAEKGIDAGFPSELRGHDAIAIVTKNRNGETAWVPLAWDGPKMKFFALERIEL